MNMQVLTAVALALLSASPCEAHAVLIDAMPAANRTVQGPAVTIRLRFNARVDAARSRVRVVCPDQTVKTVALRPQSNPGILDSEITGLTKGPYRLQWQVLSGDGHITRGEVPFQVQ